jgi:hypothetical protein
VHGSLGRTDRIFKLAEEAAMQGEIHMAEKSR